MIQPVVRDIFFLGQKSEEATPQDLAVGRDLQDTLRANRNRCVGCGLCTTRCEFDAIHLHRELPDASNMRTAEEKLKYILPNGLKQAIKIKMGGPKGDPRQDA